MHTIHAPHQPSAAAAQNFDPAITLIRMPDLEAITGLARPTVYKRLKDDPTFPRPVPLSNSKSRVSPVAVLKQGLPNAAAPLIRRIYENVSLMNAFIIDKNLYEKWFRGQEVGNREVRKVLSTSPAGEALERTQSLYYRLSDKAHPSRIAISDRFLGEGNPFTLGPVMTPSVALVSDALVRLLSLVFWFAACAALYYKPIISSHHSHFIKLYEAASTHALSINENLAGDLDRLYEEENFTIIERNPPA